ncbi:MAG: DMT family transporter [Niastella sp.]|nr:DMT family transporter [Niastella sp.]
MNKIKKDTANSITWTGFGITFLGAIMFSTKAIIVKLAFNHASVDALTLLTLRMIFSLPFYVGAVWLVNKQENATPLTRQQWMVVLVLGIFGYYLSSLFDFVGLQYISAGLERLILFLYPTFAVLINSFVFKQPIRRAQRWALVLTYVGIGLAYFGELRVDTGNPNFYYGSLLIFLCAITYSIYIAGSGYIIPKVGATKFTAYAMLAATGGIFIHFLFAGNFQALQQGAGLWWYGILLAVVATVIPSFLISYGMKRIGSNNVAIISSIGPVSTILQAHWVLGESIFLEQIVGTALVIIGVLLIGWKEKKAEK